MGVITIEEAKAELEMLKRTTLKQNGEPRADAKQENLDRIAKLQNAIASNVITDGFAGQVETSQDPPHGETDAEKIVRLEAANASYQDQLKDVLIPGIATKDQLTAAAKGNFGERPTVEAGFKAGLVDALRVKKVGDLTDRNKIDLEREIRRYVKTGGRRKTGEGKYDIVPHGFKKGLAEDEIAYAATLLERIGRGKAKDIIAMSKKELILDDEGRVNVKEMNSRYRKAGVLLDLGIVVPGMESLGNKAG